MEPRSRYERQLLDRANQMAMDAAWDRAEKRVVISTAIERLQQLSPADVQELALERGMDVRQPAKAHQLTGIQRDPGLVKAITDIAGPQTIPTWETTRPTYPSQNVRNYAVEGYRKNEIAFGCIREVSQSTSEPDIRLYRAGTDEELPRDHPAAVFIRRPNPRTTMSGWLSQLLTMMEVAGNAVAWKQRSQAGGLIGLWWLRADRLRRRLSADGTISKYVYNNGQDEIEIDWTDIYHQPFIFDLLQMDWGMSPFTVIARAVTVDNRMTDFIAKFFEQAAVPYGLITTEQFLTDEDATRIADSWSDRYAGLEGWHRPGVLGQGAKYERMGMTFQEMAADVLRNAEEARICMAFQVPPILVGANVGLQRSTFANYAEARTSFWQETLRPIYSQIEDYLNLYIAPEFGDGLEYRFDLADVSALQEDEAARWTRGITAYTSGVASWLEAREHIGLPERDDVDDNLMRTIAQVPELIGVTEQEAAPLAAVTEAAARRRGQLGRKAKGISTGFSRQRDQLVPVGQRTVERHLRDLRDSIRDRVIGDGKAATKQLPDSVDGLLDDADATDLERRLIAFRDAVGSATYDLILASYPLDVTYDPPAAFYAAVGADVALMYATIHDQLAEALVYAREADWTDQQLLDGDDDHAGLLDAIAADEGDERTGHRTLAAAAALIAADQYIAAQNAAAVMAYRDGGVTHVLVSDGDYDDACAAADGQTWTIEDADANPKEHPNCVRDFEPIITVQPDQED